MDDGIAHGLTRQYPALDIFWPAPPSDLDRELLLATIDDNAPTAVEDTALGARVFFATVEDRDRAAERVPRLLLVNCESIDVSDERWAERSQASLTPVRVGAIVVVPGKDLGGDSEVAVHLGVTSEVFIFIRPSMGFGTGHHASTRLCLALLQQTPVQGAMVLDVGTGSGVLAIAAARLGAASVRAIDNDADAIQSARENVGLNSLNEIVVDHMDLAELPTGSPVDIITANLTGASLISAAPALDALAAVPDGRLIVGGLQSDEESDVARAFARCGWTLDARVEEDGWVGLLLHRLPRV